MSREELELPLREQGALLLLCVPLSGYPLRLFALGDLLRRHLRVAECRPRYSGSSFSASQCIGRTTEK